MYDATFRICVFGDPNERKRRFMQRFLTNLFVSDSKMTIGVDFEVKSLIVDGNKVKLQIWDFGGEERFRFLLPTYARGKNGALFLYDITDYSSIAHIDDWLTVIKKEIKPEALFPIIVVGLRLGARDEENREISREDGKNIAKSRGVAGYIECDLESGENIEETFEALTRLIVDKRKRIEDENAAEKILKDIKKRSFEKKLIKASKKPKAEKKKRRSKELVSKDKDILKRDEYKGSSLSPSTLETLDELLKKLLGTIPEVKAAAIVSTEGLPIASALPEGVDETKIAAMTAALLSLSEKSIGEMNKGDFDQLYIKGSDGYLLILPAGPNAVLMVSTTQDVRLGLILLDCRRSIGRLFGDDDNLPFPYIGKPPKPPDDIAPALQAQRKIPKEKEKPQTGHDCPYCGYKLLKGQKHCPICGKEVF